MSTDAWEASRQRWARKNADPTYSMCEVHDAAGECNEECLWLVNAMGGDDYSEPMIYSDYLGGTSSIDVSGCHAPAPAAEERALLDPERRRIYYVTVHEWHTAEHGQIAAYKVAETDDTLDLVLFYRSERLMWNNPDKPHIKDTHLHVIEAGTRLTVAKATTEQLTEEP